MNDIDLIRIVTILTRGLLMGPVVVYVVLGRHAIRVVAKSMYYAFTIDLDIENHLNSEKMSNFFNTISKICKRT